MKISNKYMTDHWECVALGVCAAVALLIVLGSLFSGVEEVDESSTGAGKLERKPIVFKNACKFLDKDANKSYDLKNNPFELPLQPVAVAKPQPPPKPQQPSKPAPQPKPQQPKPQPPQQQPQQQPQPAQAAPPVEEIKPKEPVQGTIKYAFRTEKKDGVKRALLNVKIGDVQKPNVMVRAGDSHYGISIKEITDEWIEIQDAKSKKTIRISMNESEMVWLVEE